MNSTRVSFFRRFLMPAKNFSFGNCRAIDYNMLNHVGLINYAIMISGAIRYEVKYVDDSESFKKLRD